MNIYIYLSHAIFDLEWPCLTCASLFSVKWFKPQAIPCHGDSTSHKGNPLIIPGEVGERVASRHRGILPSGSPPSGESAKSVWGVFSAAPPEALRPLGDVWWRSWWQPHVWKKGTISGDAHVWKRSFLWGAKEWSYILKLGEGFESHKDYSMLLGRGFSCLLNRGGTKEWDGHTIGSS